MAQVAEQTTANTVISISPQNAVLQALQRPQYVWRTIDGLAKDTHLSPAEVQAALDDISSDVLITNTSSKGRLFSTREHYEKTQSFLGKFVSSVTGTFR